MPRIRPAAAEKRNAAYFETYSETYAELLLNFCWTWAELLRKNFFSRQEKNEMPQIFRSIFLNVFFSSVDGDQPHFSFFSSVDGDRPYFSFFLQRTGIAPVKKIFFQRLGDRPHFEFFSFCSGRGKNRRWKIAAIAEKVFFFLYLEMHKNIQIYHFFFSLFCHMIGK